MHQWDNRFIAALWSPTLYWLSFGAIVSRGFGHHTEQGLVRLTIAWVLIGPVITLIVFARNQAWNDRVRFLRWAIACGVLLSNGLPFLFILQFYL